MLAVTKIFSNRYTQVERIAPVSPAKRQPTESSLPSIITGGLVSISPAARRLAEIDFAKEAGASIGRVSPVAQAVAQTEKTKPDITVPFTQAVANVAERAAQKSVLDAYKETTPIVRRPDYR